MSTSSFRIPARVQSTSFHSKEFGSAPIHPPNFRKIHS